MRVTHVITRLIVGGAQENTAATVLGLSAYPDIAVDLLSGPTTGPEGSIEHWFKEKPGMLRVVPALVRPVRPWQDLLALVQLTKIFRTERPTLVHTHSGKAGFLGRLAASRARIPLIVHTIHGPSFGPFQGALSNQIFCAAERMAGKVTTHFIVVANAMRDQYLAQGIGQPALYTRILSGFDLEPFLQARNDVEERARLGLKPDDFVVGKIARLAPLKGHDDLFEAAPALAHKIPSIKFLLVGDGPSRAEFESKAAQAAPGRFVFTGLVQPREIPRLIGVMDALAHLSYREGLPRALPQALAAGKPVIAYDVDGAREVCLPEQTGFLLLPGQPMALVEPLSALASNPALRERLGSAGRTMVKEQFSTQRMVEQIYELYRQLREHHLGGPC